MMKLDMQIEDRSSSGIRLIPLQTRLLSKRQVFLTGEVNMDMADAFVQQMMYLDQEGEKISIYLNSCGGEVDAGLVIYDVLQSAKSSIDVYCIGHAYSMAAVLLASGPKGHRFILPHSKVMIHEPSIESGIAGSAVSVKRVSDSIAETRTLTIELLMKHTGRKKAEIIKALSYDNFMNAKEAIQFGLCDRIVDGPERVDPE